MQRFTTLAGVAAIALALPCKAAGDGAERAVRDACKQNSVVVSGKAESPTLYVDRPYLRIMVQPREETYGMREVLDYMLVNGYSAIETTVRGDLYPMIGNPPAPSLIRIGLKPAGHAACNGYETVKRYPEQEWPWLRERGLQANECIGVETITPAERSSLRILVEETVLEKRYTGDWGRVRLDVRVVDASASPERVVGRMTEHYERRGGGKAGIFHMFPCKEGDRQVNVLAQAFASKGNRATSVKIVDLEPEGQVPVAQSIGDAELSRLHWVAKPRKSWSGRVVNPEGTAWATHVPSDDAMRFNVLAGDRILRSRIPAPERGGANVTGLARTPAGGWAMITGRNSSEPDLKRYLVELDAMGKPLRVSLLTDAQYAALWGGK